MGQHARAGKGRILRIQDGDAAQSWLPSRRMAVRTHAGKRSQETFRALSCLRWNKGIALRVNLIPNWSQELQKDAATPTHHPSFPGPRGRTPLFGEPHTGSRFFCPLRALFQPPGGHRSLAASLQLLCIAVATAAALRIAHGTIGRHHLEMPQRIVGETSVFDLPFLSTGLRE